VAWSGGGTIFMNNVNYVKYAYPTSGPRVFRPKQGWLQKMRFAP
jgi:hypothetical protein